MAWADSKLISYVFKSQAESAKTVDRHETVELRVHCWVCSELSDERPFAICPFFGRAQDDLYQVP